MQLHGSNSVFDRKFGAHFNNSYVCHNKGGGALRRLRGTNFEALVLLLKNRARRLFFFCLKGGDVYFGIKTRHKGLKTSK